MTAAFVANTSWYIYNLRIGVIRKLKESGYDIIVIAPKDNYTHYIISEGYQHFDVQMSNKGRNIFGELRYMRNLLKIYRKHQPDFIFHYTIKPNIYGSIAARLAGCKSIAVVSGAGHTFIKKNALHYISIQMYRFSMRFAEEVWFVNKDDLREFTGNGITIPEKAKLLPGEGVNIQHFAPDFHFKEQKSNTIRFLLSARLIWDKGIGVFVEAARIIKRKYPHTEFALLGFLDVDNPSAISSEQIYNWHKKGYITYLGETEDVRPYVEDADCFVLPSYYREGTPRSLLEAAAMAKPIITTDNVGCREVVEHGYNGFLCKTKDPDDLARKMETIIKMTAEERRQMGLNGRKRVLQKFDENLVIRRYVEVLKRYLRLPSRKRSNRKELRPASRTR